MVDICPLLPNSMKVFTRFLLIIVLCLPTWVQADDVIDIGSTSSLRAAYFLPDAEAELLTVVLVILAGEVDFAGPEGLAHYLEHLMFWHADNVKGEPIHAREGNAWVNGMVTSYYNRGEVADLDDMMTFAQRIFSQPKLPRTFMLGERDVVEREYDYRVAENPDWRVFTQLRKQLYDGHPISRSVIGTPESIESLTLAHASEFHAQFYKPANAVLVVAGNSTKEQIEKLVSSRFAKNELVPEIENTKHAQFWRRSTIGGQLDKVTQYSERQAKSSRFIYSSLSNWSNENQDSLQGHYTQQFAQRLLESALPGSLAKPLRLDNFIISGYELEVFMLLDGQVELNIIAWPDKGVTIDSANQKLVAALQELGETGVPLKSFERIKKRWLQTARRESNDSELLLWRSWYHIMLGEIPNTHADHLNRIESVTLSDLNGLIKAISNPQRKTIGLIIGEE